MGVICQTFDIMTKNVKFSEKVAEIASSSEFALYVFINISKMKTPRVTFDPSKSSQGTTALEYIIYFVIWWLFGGTYFGKVQPYPLILIFWNKT